MNRRHDSREFDFRGLGDLGSVDLAVFTNGFLCVGVAIGSTDENRGLAVGDAVNQGLLRKEDRASRSLGGLREELGEG